MTADMEMKLTTIPGYSFLRMDREVRHTNGRVKKGGGVGIHCKSTLHIDDSTVKHLNLSNKTVELQWLIVSRPYAKKILLGNIYRPPDGNAQAALDEIGVQMAQMQDIDKYEVLLLGDFNTDTNAKKCVTTRQISQFEAEHALKQIIDKPTRYSKMKNSTLDLIFTNVKYVTDYGVYNYNVSDHKLIYAIKKKPRNCKLTTLHRGRTYRHCTPETLKEAVRGANKQHILTENDPTRCWDKLEKLIIEIADEQCPMVDIPIRISTQAYLNNELLELQRDRDYFSDKADRSGDQGDQFVADCLHKRAQSELKKGINNYFKDQAVIYGQNPNKFWYKHKQINPENKEEITSLVDTETDVKIPTVKLPGKINDYFADIGVKLADKFTVIDKDKKNYKPKINTKKLEINAPSKEDILATLLKTSEMKSSGMKDLNTKFLKDIMTILIDEVTHLYAMVVESEVFPVKWKIATVTPIPKVKNPRSCNELRPISILPLPGRIIERIIHDQIKDFLETTMYLVPQQNGFRKNKSTTKALAAIIDRILIANDGGDLAVAVFLDFKKAFDTVNHQILIWKLERAGLSRELCNLIQDYLSDRQQITVMGKQRSEPRKITTGVPQGSTLGPLLFLVYINDLVKVSSEADFFLFADDAAIIVHSENLNQTAEILNRVLALANTWFDENQLTLNIGKTQYVVFGSKKKLSKAGQIEIKIGTEKLKEATEYKYLGTILDNTLSAVGQLARLNQQLAIKMTTFRKIRSCMSVKTAILIYKATILPVIDYNDLIYNFLNKQQQQKLQRTQNRALRIVFRGNNLSVAEMHERAGLNQLEMRRELHLLTMMYSRAGDQSYVDSTLRHTRRAEAILLKVPRPHSNKLTNAPVYKGATAWNELPVTVRQSKTELAFKNRVKLYLTGSPPHPQAPD